MNLDPDLQRILNVNAKVYNVKTKAQGKVIEVSDSEVHVDYNKAIEKYSVEEFKQKLVDDEIVSNSRLTMGQGNQFKVLPRSGSNAVSQTPKSPSVQKPVINHKEQKLEVGYINFKTGRFSEEPKRGYTKVEYKKSTQKVTLEIDEDQLRKLKELGLV